MSGATVGAQQPTLRCLRAPVGADQPHIIVAECYLGGIPPQPDAVVHNFVVGRNLHIFRIQ